MAAPLICYRAPRTEPASKATELDFDPWNPPDGYLLASDISLELREARVAGVREGSQRVIVAIEVQS